MSRRQRKRSAAAPSQKSPSKSVPQSKGPHITGWLMRIGLGLVVVLLLGVLGCYLWVKTYLRSDEFREQLGQQIGSAAGGRAEVGAIEWHGADMELSEVSLMSRKAGEWKLHDVGVEVDLSGFWDKVWIVPKVEIRQARSEWDFREVPEREVIAKGGRPASSGRKKKGGGWLPNRTEVHELLVRDYEGEVRTDQGDYSWDGVALSSQPRQQFSNVVNLQGGRLQTPHEWASLLRLKSGALNVSGEGLEVIASEWTGDGFESLEVTGVVGEESRLSALFKEWEAKAFLPIEWQEVLNGRLSGSADWTPEMVEGDLVVNGGVLQGLSFLDRLAAYAGTARLKKLSFEEARAKVRKEEGSWEVRDLILFDEGLLRVEGVVAGQAEVLSGRLEVGVPPGLLAHIPGAEEKVFLPGKNGMLWATVNLSGTVSRPQEDLSERMIRAAGERMLEMIPETGQWALRYSGEALDQGTALLLENQGLILEEGTQVVEEVLEQGGDVVEEGVKTGFGILNGILGGDE